MKPRLCSYIRGVRPEGNITAFPAELPPPTTAAGFVLGQHDHGGSMPHRRVRPEQVLAAGELVRPASSVVAA
jgi:hypothetical protein